MRQIARLRRAKVSATLPPRLIKQVQEYQKEAGLPNFSAALEELLSRELLEQRSQTYYRSMSEEERSEQEAWSRLSTAEAARTLSRT